MSPRTGRPKVEKPKSHDIKVRIDDETYDELLVYCEKNEMNKAKAIRKAILLLLKH